MGVLLVDTGTREHFLQRFLVYFFVAIVQNAMFFGVLIKLVKVRVRAFVDVRVSKEVQQIT